MTLYNIEVNRADLLEALEKADRMAYECTCYEYRVMLVPDGTLEIDSFLARSSSRYMNDDRIRLYTFCHQYYDIMEEWFCSEGHLLSALAGDVRKAACEAMEEGENVFSWLEHNEPEIYENLRNEAIDEVVSETDYDAFLRCIIQDEEWRTM